MKQLIFWYLPVLFVQIVSGLITRASIQPWYGTLQKASWNPPAWVFGPAWTLLYIMMTIAVWLVSRSKADSKIKTKAYALFGIQLALNGLWSILFFGLHKPDLALIDLGLLIGVVAWTSVVFYNATKWAGVMMIPYLLWIIYAFTLNFAIWQLNTN